MPNHPFQLRDHGGNVIEMIVIDEIRADHKVVEALKILLKKFDYVILSLSETASLHPSFSQALPGLTASGKLMVVAREDEQVGIDLGDTKRFKVVDEAENRVKGERSVAAILEHIKKISPMQSATTKLMTMLRNPDTNLEDIENVTRTDPKLVMRMLKISNSPFFMRLMPFENLMKVIAFLGIDGLRQIVMQETFEGFAKVFANQREKLGHMRRCAHLSAYMGKLIGADQNYVGKMLSAGLLHDMGALVLCSYDSHEYARVTMKVRNDKKTVCEAEVEVFGIDHQELGGILIPKMGMPDELIPVLTGHHSSSIPLDNLVLLSTVIANGYLNQHIEKLSFTPYEQYLPVLAEEYRKNRGMQSAVLTSDDEDMFRAPEIFEVLKKELDKYVMSGNEAQGL